MSSSRSPDPPTHQRRPFQTNDGPLSQSFTQQQQVPSRNNSAEQHVALFSSRTSTKTKYLIFYNLVSAGLWLAILNRVVTFTVTRRKAGDLYAENGYAVRWVQTVALAEVVHALLGIVRAPVFTTFLQVASRVVLIWGIVENFPVTKEWAYTSMLLAWSVTEVVRYTYFVMSLTGQVPPILIWMRYNLFFVLYPLGIGSEAWLVYKSMPNAMEKNPLLGYLMYAILGIYVPGSYVLYTHMMAQRRRVLRGKQRARD